MNSQLRLVWDADAPVSRWIRFRRRMSRLWALLWLTECR
jgi:hypothetical protein